MPPFACGVRVIDCPLSIVGEGGVTAPAVSAGLTVTELLGEQTEDAEYAESVTLYE